MSKRALGLIGVLLAAAVLAAAPRAQACSCPANFGSVAWPLPDAQGVATDVTLIVYASSGADVRFALQDSQGQAVDLLAVRTLDAASGCGLNDVVFFAPMKPLSPGARYQATVSFGSPDAKIGAPTVFTTGAGPRVAAPVPNTERHLMGQLFADGGRLLQLFAENPAAEPVFIVTRGQPGTDVRGLGPLALEHPTSISLGTAICADVELVDVTGATLLHDMMCEPEKCDRSELVEQNSCTVNVGSSIPWSVWQTRPTGCGADGNAPGGCAISPARDDRAPLAVAAATLPLLAWARRRRRDRR